MYAIDEEKKKKRIEYACDGEMMISSIHQ